MSYKTADIKRIIQDVKDAKDHKRCVAILMGAGMSVSADIPAANGVMDDIKKRFPASVRNAERSYAAYMSALSKGQRDDLIKEYVSKAKLNWAHIHLASLIKAKYIDRVLTVNFDPLVVRSLSMLNIYPAVYDFAASQYFEPDGVVDPSVFYLHGQHTGFVMLHEQKELDRHAEKLGNVFEDSGRDRLWIVVGYSGYNDPVLKRLSGVNRFKHNLFWIGYKDNPPAEHVQNDLLGKEGAFHVPGYDADGFFRELAMGVLKTHLPSIIDKPFTHLKDTLSMIAPYPVDDKTTDPTEQKRKWIEAAIDGFEKDQGFEKIEAARRELERDKIIQATRDAWINDEYGKLDELRQKVESLNIPQARGNLAHAYYNWGVTLYEQGDYTGAIEKSHQAIELKPDNAVAYIIWGLALGGQGNCIGEIEKYRKAIELKPDYAEAYNNWGFALGKQGNAAGAIEKYQKAIELKPDIAEAYENLLNIFLLHSDVENFRRTLDLCRTNCKSLTNRDNHIIQGLALLNAICTGLDIKADYESFIDSASDNVPLKNWVSGVWDKFYENSKSRLDEKSLEKIKAIISLWKGEKSLDDFKQDVASWFA